MTTLGVEKRQQLRPLIPRLVGTAGDGRDEARGFLALDWLIRTYLPTWLRLVPALTADADALTAHRPIVDLESAASIGPLVRGAESHAAVAGDAAWAVAGAGWLAAGEAWNEAAGREAGAAAEDAAGAAAEDAAWNAAWNAAGAAAAAAGLAAGAAARAAARAVLQPAVDALQDSAIALFDRLITAEATR